VPLRMVVEVTKMIPGLEHQIPHVVEACVVGGLGWFAKFIGSAISNEWKEVKATLHTIKTTSQEQTSNHLHTIEENTSKTNVLLEKVVENQIETNGFLKGWASRG
jgi:formiminotetrahydrofolate cyclodeaminase